MLDQQNGERAWKKHKQNGIYDNYEQQNEEDAKKEEEHNGAWSNDKQQNDSKENVERKQKCNGGCNNNEHQTIKKIRWMAQWEWKHKE